MKIQRTSFTPSLSKEEMCCRSSDGLTPPPTGVFSRGPIPLPVGGAVSPVPTGGALPPAVLPAVALAAAVASATAAAAAAGGAGPAPSAQVPLDSGHFGTH